MHSPIFSSLDLAVEMISFPVYNSAFPPKLQSFQQLDRSMQAPHKHYVRDSRNVLRQRIMSDDKTGEQENSRRDARTGTGDEDADPLHPGDATQLVQRPLGSPDALQVPTQVLALIVRQHSGGNPGERTRGGEDPPCMLVFVAPGNAASLGVFAHAGQSTPNAGIPGAQAGLLTPNAGGIYPQMGLIPPLPYFPMPIPGPQGHVPPPPPPPPQVSTGGGLTAVAQHLISNSIDKWTVP